MLYRYETHLHTCQGSACGKSEGRAYVRAYQRLGYAGVCVTDHFLHGNCAVPRDWPWEQQVRRFCEGYEDCKREGDRLGFAVFFGWEQNFEGDEFLVYGLSPEWLLAHPEMLRWSRAEQFARVHAYGGAVVQAHPFRDRGYIAHHTLSPLWCDAAEVYNTGNHDPENALCQRYCAAFGLAETAGSDIHDVADVTPEKAAGLVTEKPLRTAGELAALLVSGRGYAPALPGPCAAQTAPEARALADATLAAQPAAHLVKPIFRGLASGELAPDDLAWLGR